MASMSATVRVEKATSDLLIGPDWTMNMDICDSINSEHWQAKDVVKAVKKRLQHKNPMVQFLALTLLETMIKNCSDYVHFQVVDRGILREMIKIVRKKTDMQVRDKILVLLDSWQEAFGGPGGKYPQYYLAYVELKRSGVEFPQRDPDSALIFTPPITHSVAAVAAQPRLLRIGYGMPSNSSVRLDEAMASEMTILSLSDLERFRSVMDLLSDMLKAVNPGDREAVKDEVIVDLVAQCRSNQKRIMQLVNSTGDEELLGQGLELNDALQSLLAKNDALVSGSPLPVEPSNYIPPLPDEESESIPVPITNTSIVLASSMTNHFKGEEEEEDEDDFAQLVRRNSKYKSVTQTAPETKETARSTPEASSTFIETNSLVLPNPPAPVKTSNKEQDMIDLLSITSVSNPSPPRTPITPPSASFQNRPPVPVSPNVPWIPYTVHQGYNIPYNSYTAPWAQSHSRPQPPAPQIPSSYPPPPWESTSSSDSNPFPASTNQFPSYLPMFASQPQQQFNSFGSGVNNVAGVKPYVHSDKLFDDLIVYRNAKYSSTSPMLSGSPSQG